VLGPIFAGYLFDLRGSYDLAFQVFALLNLVALAALVCVRAHPRRASGTPGGASA